MIRITSKQHLFRRCGVAHPKGPVEYPDGKFSKDQLKTLKAEPMLKVEILHEPLLGDQEQPGFRFDRAGSKRGSKKDQK